MPVPKAERSRLKPDDRKRHIVDATITSLAKHGPQRCTLRQVARDSGIAPSLITYFFTTWSDLLLEAYRTLSVTHDQELQELNDKYGDNAAKNMDLFLHTFFSEYWTGDRIAGAHISLWALARGDVDLSSEMTTTTQHLKERTSPLIASLGCERRCDITPETINDTFYALTSGLWYEIAVNPNNIDRDQAIRMSWTYLDTAIPDNRRGAA